MSEHKTVAVIPGEPDAVFAYLADVDKLPAYLPMVTSATRTGREDAVIGIRVRGVPSTHGVWVRAYRDRRHLAWGTVDNAYRGEAHVSPPRAGSTGRPALQIPPADLSDRCAISLVTITLESDHHPDVAFQRALDEAASALGRAIRGGMVDR
jgi:hypothetical protein